MVIIPAVLCITVKKRMILQQSKKNQGKTSHIFKIYFNFVVSDDVLTRHI